MTRAGWVVAASWCLLLSGLGGCAVTASTVTASTTVVTVPPPADTTTATPAPPLGSATAPRATETTGGPLTPSTSTRVDPTGPVVDVPDTRPFTVFASPSGNIVCGGGKGEQGWDLRCDVLEHTWSLPPRPASCDFDWGHGTYLTGGRAGLTCVSDALGGSDAVGLEGTWWNGRPGSQVVTTDRGRVVALAYGAGIRLGSILCLSRVDGMHCTDSSTGAGFDISRDSYRLR